MTETGDCKFFYRLYFETTQKQKLFLAVYF